MAWDESIETSLRPVQESGSTDMMLTLNMKVSELLIRSQENMFQISLFKQLEEKHSILRQKVTDEALMLLLDEKWLPLETSTPTKIFGLSFTPMELLVLRGKMALGLDSLNGLIKMDSNMQSKPSQKNG